MPSTKISALASGAPTVTTDELVIARAGANYKLTVANLFASPTFTGTTVAAAVTPTSLRIGTLSYTNILAADSGAAPVQAPFRLAAASLGSLSGMVYAADNVYLSFDQDFTGNQFVARNATVANLYKTGGNLKIAGSGGNSVDAASTNTDWVTINLTSGAVGMTGTVVNMVTSGTTLTVGVGANNGTVSAGVFTDRTKYFEGDALAQLNAVQGTGGHIDHATLPAFARVNIKRDVIADVERTVAGKTVLTKEKVGEETAVERDLGAMVSMLTVALKQLTERLETVEATLASAKPK